MFATVSRHLPLLEIPSLNETPTQLNQTNNAASPRNIHLDLESIPDTSTIGAKQTETLSVFTKAFLIAGTLVIVMVAIIVPVVYYSLNGQYCILFISQFFDSG
ncbi:unnamed protein product [Rotaria sp. Silwood1]|nr:unnamed protein product [Rotaria sp. Silwood1]